MALGRRWTKIHPIKLVQSIKIWIWFSSDAKVSSFDRNTINGLEQGSANFT